MATIFQRIRAALPASPALQSADFRPKRSIFNTLIFHFRPRSVRPETLQFTLTWGLGGIAVVLAMLQLGSGILLKFAYRPTVADAYHSIAVLQTEIPFGRLVRNVHHWGANLLVVVVFFHFLRVLFTGAFQAPRQLNWVIGIALFGTVLVANFTGYLLPWDQLAYWAVTICTGMLEYVPGIGLALQAFFRGGPEIGPAALQLFYTLHTALIPAAFVFLMGFHFWRIRKAGGLVVPRPAGEKEPPRSPLVPSVPHLFMREAAVAFSAIAVIFLASVFFDAPLGAPANPGLSPNPTKAPWYFAGLQELLIHLHPTFAVLVIPGLLLGALLLLPFLDFPKEPASAGVWFSSRTGRSTASIAAAAALVLTPASILTDEFLLDNGGRAPLFPPMLTAGLIPTTLIVAVAAGIYLLVRRKYCGSLNDGVQAAAVFLIVAFVVLTIVCVWFRGAEMRLVWP
jgi:quinol-cytochrome oxidoreductase complex cytochrome b subunit